MEQNTRSVVEVRTAKIPKDFPGIYELWRNAGPGIQLGPSDSIEEILKKQSFEPLMFLVSEVNEKIVGAVLGGFDGRRGIIYHLAVNKDFRNQGIGEELMVEIEKRLKELGCIRSYLLIVPGNDEAMRFYSNRGWGVQDLLVMAKDL